MIYIKNLAGLSSELGLVPLVSPFGLAHLKEHVSSGSGSAYLAELVELLASLPLRNQFCISIEDFTRPNNFHEPMIQHGFCSNAMYGVVIPGKFKSNSPSYHPKVQISSPTPEGLGWTKVDRIIQLTKAVGSELEALGVDVPPVHLASLKRTCKRSKEWSIVIPDASSMLEAQCCAIYKIKQQGFINDKNDPVPLAGARLFESTEAARRTIVSHGWQNDTVIVNVSVQVEGLEHKQQNYPSDLGSLGLLGRALVEKEASILQDVTPEATSGTLSRRPRM